MHCMNTLSNNPTPKPHNKQPEMRKMTIKVKDYHRKEIADLQINFEMTKHSELFPLDA